MSLRRDTVQGALSALVTVGSRIVLTALLARTLGPSAFGELMFAQWVLEMLVLVAGLGAPAVLTRFLPGLRGRDDAHARQLRRWLLLACSLAFLLCLLGFVAWLGLLHDVPPSAADPGRLELTLLFLCASYLAVCFATPLLQGLLRYDAVLCGSLAGALAAPLLVHATVHPGDVADAALALGAAFALNALVSLLWLLRRQSRDAGPAAPAGEAAGNGTAEVRMRDIAGYAGNSWAAGLVAGMVWMRGELGVLKLQVSSAGIAFYSGALTIAGAVTQVAGLVTSALLPHLVRARQQGDTARVVEMLGTTTQAALLLTTLCAFVLLTFSEALVAMLLGGDFLAAAPIVDILAISSVAIASGSAATLLQVETNGRFALVSNALALAVLLTLSVLLTPLAGAAGAAVARCVAQACVAELVYRRLGALPGFAGLAARLARAQRIAIAMLLLAWAMRALSGDGAVVAATVGLPCLAIALALVRAVVGVPIGRMLRMDGRPA